MLNTLSYPQKFGIGISPNIRTFSVMIVSLGDKQVARLQWDLGDDINPPIYSFLILKRYFDRDEFEIVGSTEATFFDDKLEGIDDFRLLPQLYYRIISLFSTFNANSSTPLAENQEIDLPKGVYFLVFYDEFVGGGKVGFEINNVLKEFDVPALILLATTGTIKFKFVGGANFAYIVNIGSISDVASPLSADSERENKLGGMLHKVLREESRRLSEVYYPNFGEEVVLLSRKRSGKRCPSCYSETIGTSVYKNCLVCFGTGYEGGYHKYLTRIVFANPREQWIHGPQQVGDWLGPRTFEIYAPMEYPLRPMDIIVRQDGTRYVVGRPNYFRVTGIAIQQTAYATLLDNNHPAYGIPVDFSYDLKHDELKIEGEKDSLQFNFFDYYNNIVRHQISSPILPESSNFIPIIYEVRK